MDESPWLVKTNDILDIQNPWSRISEIAARVGVAPREAADPASVVVLGADGKYYDIWSVIAAVLDKIETASK
jgi:hypothetical protein